MTTGRAQRPADAARGRGGSTSWPRRATWPTPCGRARAPPGRRWCSTSTCRAARAWRRSPSCARRHPRPRSSSSRCRTTPPSPARRSRAARSVSSSKRRPTTSCVEAVRLAAAGETYLNPRLGAPVAAAPPPAGPPDDLTEREVDVLRLIALGHTNAEIGEQLYLSVRTVETHRAHIQQKTRPLHARRARALRDRAGLIDGLIVATGPSSASRYGPRYAPTTFCCAPASRSRSR